MKKCLKSLLFLTLGIFLLPEQHAAAEDGWSLTLYGGRFSDSDLVDNIALNTNLKDSYLSALAISKEFATSGKYIAWEAEGQIVKHYGLQDHFEFNAVLAVRWLPFPWDKYLDTSFAFGGGFSYATEIPKIETDGSMKTLPYLMLEFAFSFPKIPQWSVVTRIHHRSGGYGLSGTDEASNFLAIGVRYRFGAPGNQAGR